MLSFPTAVLGYESVTTFCKICLHILFSALKKVGNYLVTIQLMAELGYLLSAAHRKLYVCKKFKRVASPIDDKPIPYGYAVCCGSEKKEVRSFLSFCSISILLTKILTAEIEKET